DTRECRALVFPEVADEWASQRHNGKKPVESSAGAAASGHYGFKGATGIEEAEHLPERKRELAEECLHGNGAEKEPADHQQSSSNQERETELGYGPGDQCSTLLPGGFYDGIGLFFGDLRLGDLLHVNDAGVGSELDLDRHPCGWWNI